MSKQILITGASGLIGSQLTKLLTGRGHHVTHLGRSRKDQGIPSFVWDVAGQKIDAACLNGIDTIIHLAGANVAERRWTARRKKEILESRTRSTQLLAEALANNRHTVTAFVSASAIGYYGFDNPEKIFVETDLPGSDFLAQVTRQWEDAVDKIGAPGIRTTKVRIGVVLSQGGGALTAMTLPIRAGIGSRLGSGQQYVSWIHADDLCDIFVKAVEDDRWSGVYNAAAGWCTNRELTEAIARTMRKPLWVPAVPPFALRLVLGEMANIVLNGSKVSSERIQAAGFIFRFTNLTAALKDLLTGPRRK